MAGSVRQPAQLLVDGARHQADLRRAGVNYAAAVHADKWIPVLPNTDAALYLAIAHQWFKDGTYDKDYIETHAYGFDKFEDYVMGREDGQPKTPEWAAPISGVPARTIKALAKDWASNRTTVCIGNGGPGIRGPYATEPGSSAAHVARPCRAWASRAVTRRP